MTTAFPTDLSKLISADLVTYLGAGVLNRNRIAGAADYSGLEIEEFERLKQLHFVLQDDVVEYIEALPSRLRRIKTTHRRTETEVRGEVRGRINWPRTTERRTSAGYNDRTLFVIENPTVEVNIPENKVVKKLLSLLSEPLTEEIENTDQEWRAAWDDADIVALQQTLVQNVYLDALPEPAAIRLTDRDVTAARRARQPLYTEAAKLYRLYDDLMNDRFQRPGIQELLQETIVTPTQDHKLFELFCVFALIRRLRQQYPDLQLRRIQSGMDAIAILESEHSRVEVYYDKGGHFRFSRPIHGLRNSPHMRAQRCSSDKQQR